MGESRELQDYMKKKSKEAIGEKDLKSDNDNGDVVKDAPKSINQDAPMGDTRAAKAMMILRIVLNMLFIIPLVLVIIALFAYIALKVLPSTIYFIKQLLIRLLMS